MTAALLALAALGVALLAIAFGPSLRLAATRSRELARERDERPHPSAVFDPGRELRAERKARDLMASVVDADDVAMYDALGFLRLRPDTPGGEPAHYAYLIYPHRPIVAYEIASGRMLSEYCIEFPDSSEPELGTRLPDADDVLAKWMGLRAGERSFLVRANLHQPGRQIDPERIRRDIVRVEEWLRRAPQPGGAELEAETPA